MKKKLLVSPLILMVTLAVFADVIVDSTGHGFVGKGDVQLALGLNNKAMQNTAVNFAMTATTETSWTCDKDSGPQTQERNRTTTIQSVLASEARVKNQITGYHLNGFSGTPTVIASDGPAAGSCPTGWTAIDLVTEPGEGGGLTVNGVALPITPVL